VSEQFLSVDPILSRTGVEADSESHEIESIEMMNENMSEENRNDNQSSSALVESSVGADVVVEGVDEDHEVDVIDGLEDAEHEGSEHDDIAEAPEGQHDESDSESDSNPDDSSYHSNLENTVAQNSSTVGAVQSSDRAAPYFSEDESADSSNAEDEEESEAGETEPDTEDPNYLEDSLERRSNGVNTNSNIAISTGSSVNSSSQGVRSNLAQHLQWALRHREITSGTNVPISSSSNRISTNALVGSAGLAHIDPSTIQRRSTTTTVAPLPSTAAKSEGVSMATTAISLARAFSIVIRQIAALLPILNNLGECPSGTSSINGMTVTYAESVNLLNHISNRLRPTWNWLMTVMDATEGQLRFGCALSNNSDGSVWTNSSFSNNISSSQHSSSRVEDNRSLINDSRSSGNSRRNAVNGNSKLTGSNHYDDEIARRDFLSYAISLMRAQNNEHFDSMPVLDVSSLKHVAYILDALIYYMRAGNEGVNNGKSLDNNKMEWPQETENEVDEHDEESTSFQSLQNDMSNMDEDSMLNSSLNSSQKGKKHPFFQRSNSTLFLGCPPPDPFASPLSEALPLAEHPHLLQPNSRREDLFSVPRYSLNLLVDNDQHLLNSLPSRISLSERTVNDNLEAKKFNDFQSLFSNNFNLINDSSIMDQSIASSSSNTVSPSALWSLASTSAPTPTLASAATAASASISVSMVPPTSTSTNTTASRSQSVITETSKNRSPIIVAPGQASNKSSVIVHAASVKANNSHSSTKQKKRKKSNHPSDIYDFNDNEDDIDQDNFSPTLLWSQKRADRKGDFKVFCSRMKDQIVKENPELNEEEIDKLLSSKWDLLSDDFKAQYRPLEPFSTPNSKLNQKSSNSRKSLPKSNRKRKLDKSASPAVLNDKPKMEDKSKEAKDSGLSEDETALIIDEPTTPKKSRNRASLKSATSTPISSKVLKSNRSKSSSKTQEKPPLPKKPKSLSIKHRFDKLESEPDTNLKTPKVSAKQANATSTKKSESKRASLKSVS